MTLPIPLRVLLRTAIITMVALCCMPAYMTLGFENFGPEGPGPSVASAQSATFERPLRVVTTIYPHADIVRAIGGDHVSVTHLLPAGASPHTFEPRPGQIREAARADLLVWNGAQLDDWMQKLATASNVRAQRLILAEGAPLLPAISDGDDIAGHGDGDHGHGHGAYDPHFWLDPVLVRDHLAPRIAAVLTELAPLAGPAFQKNLSHFQDALTALDAEIRQTLASVTERRFIVHHSAWRYFAARYGLEEMAALSASPGREPSARWLADLARLSRDLGVTTVFAEPQLNPQAAHAMAGEIGGVVLILDPLGGPDLDDRSTYVDLMRYNARTLRDGLTKNK